MNATGHELQIEAARAELLELASRLKQLAGAPLCPGSSRKTLFEAEGVIRYVSGSVESFGGSPAGCVAFFSPEVPV